MMLLGELGIMETAATVNLDDTTFNWDHALLTLGVATMDAEHRMLVSLMAQLSALSKSGAPHAQIEKTLRQLDSCMARHFRDEEGVMELIKFPDFENHKETHKRLQSRMSEFVGAYAQSPEAVLPKEFFGFLKEWLFGHIAGEDRKYTQHGGLF